jgi:quinoprotein glucose dehydrogenase
MSRTITLSALLVSALLFGAGCERSIEPTVLEQAPETDWPAWGGTAGGGHYTPLAQITAANVDSLELAWVHRSGDVRQGPAANATDFDLDKMLPASAFQATPIVVEDKLFYCTPFNRVFALNPATGAEVWMFDPQVDMSKRLLTNCRGVSSWVDPERPKGAACRLRIYAPTLDARIIALDGETGQRCDDFSDDGQIELAANIGPHEARAYAITSPPAIINGLLVTGAFVLDAWDTQVPAGVVRAFDLRSGEQRWAWNPVAPGRPAVDAEGHYVRGTTNVWSVITVDEKLNRVYVPTGNSSPDYYGGHREGHLDHYSSSVVALDASSGEVDWHVQTVHHDIWDFDVPSQPTLVDLDLEGRTVPALVQMTKMGMTWVLDRRNGESLFPIEQRSVPQKGAVAGEYLAPTQPFPLKPDHLHALDFGPQDAWGLTFWDRGQCRDKIAGLDSGPIYTPISETGTVLYPAPTGGNNWGSPAIDPQRKILIANTVHLPIVAKLIPRAQCGKSGRELPQLGTPYCVTMDVLNSPLGAPCSAPPWATLSAIDLISGDKLWQVPLGTLADALPVVGRFFEGSPGFGGPLLTRSGLIFIAATVDHYLRVYAAADGAELLKLRLPSQAASVPMSYRTASDPRQFVVLAVGGHWAGLTESTDHLMAFALKAAP